MRRMLFPTTAFIALSLLAACSSDNTSVAPSSTAGASTTVPATSTTLGTDTTLAPPSTEPASTPAPTVAPPTGWTVVDPASLGAPLAFPCCGSNWYGATASPALPPAGQPLADGVYRISIDWPADPSQPLTATVSRFDQCSVLPAGSCEDMGGSYAPDEYGVVPSGAVEITLTLDATMQVVLGGYTGFETENADAFRMGSGTDFAVLLAQLDADYDVAIAQPIAAGTPVGDVVAALAATPANGFAAPPDEMSGALTYTFGDAPPLLFQAVEYDRGSDIVGSISLQVVDGQYTLFTYAGFYS